MGKEIITIGIGGCGVGIGCKYWQQICEEHAIDYMGNYTGEKDEELHEIDVSFKEGTEKFIPRALFVDQDAVSCETISERNMSYLFDAQQMLFDNTDVQNNFASVYCTQYGQNLAKSAGKKLRKEVELCDSFHGFQIIHGCAGGVGSGLTSLLLEDMKWKFPSSSIVTASVYPAEAAGHIILSPLNTTLLTRRIIENSDMSICFDNGSMVYMCEALYQIDNVHIVNINDAICCLLTRANAGLRFRGTINCDLKKLICNMVPFPRISFIAGTFEPLTLKNPDLSKFNYENPHVTISCWPENPMFDVNLFDGNFISVACLFRGNWDNEIIDRKLSEFQFNSNYKFVKWIPRHIISNLIRHPEPYIDTSAAFLTNHTSMGTYFSNLKNKFDQMFGEHKEGVPHPYLHHYTNYGLSEDQFYEASAMVEDLALQYLSLKSEEPKDDKNAERK